jgi:Asp/Glu/hydantoin racemase
MGIRKIASLVPAGVTEAHAYMRVPDDAVTEGFQSDMFELGGRVSFATPIAKTFAELAYLEAGLRAQDEGYSAIMINATGDYALRQLRSLVSIPVVGTGQASMHAALGLGDRFGLLTIWPPQLRPVYEGLIDDNGFRSRCVGISFVTSEDELSDHRAQGGFGITLQAKPAPLLERLEARAADLVASGADVIVLGCVCMVPVLEELQSRLDVPVVNPLTAAHSLAELLVSLKASVPRKPVDERYRNVLRSMIANGAQAGLTSATECGDACEIATATQ